MELRFHVSNGSIERIQEVTNINCATDIGRDAMALYGWAVAQAEAGRQIYAMDPTGGSVQGFDTPILFDVRGGEGDE